MSCAAYSAEPIGKVVAVLGSPSASGPGGDRKLSGGAALFEDDKITVGSAGNAQIMLNDGTKLVVGPGSSLLLDKYLMGSGGSAQKVGIKALRGTFRFITGRSAKSAYNISTANATIGIRGTGFDFWVRSRTGVTVLNGVVNLNGNGGSVTLRANCETGVTTGNGAQQLQGRSQANQLRQSFPFILNQSGLRRIFWLPTQRCSSILTRADRGTGGGGSNTPPGPPPSNSDNVIGSGDNPDTGGGSTCGPNC